MSGNRLWTWIAMILALCLGLAAPAGATPIVPKIRNVVHESQAAPVPFVPSRAGWQGSEMPPVRSSLDATVTLRANKAALITAAIPDPRAVLAVILVIALMRLLRRIQEEQKRRQPATVSAIDALDTPEGRKAA